MSSVPPQPIDPDATIMVPTPGRRRASAAGMAPAPAGSDPARRSDVAITADLGALSGLNPLVALANALLALVPQIRSSVAIRTRPDSARRSSSSSPASSRRRRSAASSRRPCSWPVMRCARCSTRRSPRRRGAAAAVDEAEPARHLLPRDRRRREVLPAAQQDGRAAGRQYRSAGVLLRLPRARLRRPLPRDRRRQGAARADARAPVRADPQAAPARGSRPSERWKGIETKREGSRARSCCG